MLHTIPNLEDLGRTPELARELPPTAIAALLVKCAAIQAALAAALAEASTGGHGSVAAREGDQLLTVEETAALLKSTKDWVYRHAAELPFAVRLGGQLRFSADGLQRHIQAKTTKPVV